MIGCPLQPGSSQPDGELTNVTRSLCPEKALKKHTCVLEFEANSPLNLLRTLCNISVTEVLQRSFQNVEHLDGDEVRRWLFLLLLFARTGSKTVDSRSLKKGWHHKLRWIVSLMRRPSSLLPSPSLAPLVANQFENHYLFLFFYFLFSSVCICSFVENHRKSEI